MSFLTNSSEEKKVKFKYKLSETQMYTEFMENSHGKKCEKVFIEGDEWIWIAYRR